MIADGHDALLVDASRRGELVAFEALYERHVAAVTAIARDQLRDPDQVAEVVQETFTRALESLPRLGNADRFHPWLLAIARHAAVDARRGSARRRPELLDTTANLAAAEPGPHELAEISELAGVVRGAVKGLSRRDATAMGLVALGFGVRDVATALGIAPGAAKVAIHRARRRLSARVLMHALARRQTGGCAELAALPAPDARTVARHLRTCETCADAVRTVLA